MQTTSGPSRKRVAIVGAGPIGVEAAAYLGERGHDVTLYEAGEVGAHVDAWRHVRFFSPWKLNRSTWGRAALEKAGVQMADGDAFPLGGEYLEDYLRPLAKTAVNGGLREQTRVTGITRAAAWKGDFIGNPTRGQIAFLVASEGPAGPSLDEYDVVFDATGTFASPADMGVGGLPAFGEADADERIERHIPRPLDRDRALYADKTILVIGQGHSAATTMHLLSQLRESATDTTVVWLRRDDERYVELDDDPLPQRRKLAEFANRAAAGGVSGITALAPGVVTRIGREKGRLAATIRGADGETRLVVDRIVSNVGYRPDMELTRELQVHHCYASEGPMKLAASLLAQSGNTDCLAQEVAGVDTLRNPEPNFFVVGAKSYGRNSNFLLRVGLEQIEAIAKVLEKAE